MANGQVTENKWTINRGETDFWFLYKYQNYIEVVIGEINGSLSDSFRIENTAIVVRLLVNFLRIPSVL